jgi:hypothetical protein
MDIEVYIKIEIYMKMDTFLKELEVELSIVTYLFLTK